MSTRKIYWICQLSGWFGMVAIEMINYTFFILGKFSITLLYTFIGYAIIGISCTHVYKIILNKRNYFGKATFRIWLSALLSTILISAILAAFNLIPSIILNFSFFLKNIRFIDIAGMIINWMRYIGAWVIIYFMYKILQQNNAIQQEKLTIENLAKTTELELLKIQLNPHFLFNALNSIKALVIINPEQSRDAIVKLSELLRFTLQYGKERLIPLADELNEVKKYLELEQLRFGKRLSVQYHIGENTLSQMVPPAIVLTLAENAVKHGAAKQMNECTIEVKTFIGDNNLSIHVINGGAYQPQHMIGIGLKHIRLRLDEVFHHQAVFSIGQQQETVLANIQIPVSWP